jgi:hypothetical protein
MKSFVTYSSEHLTRIDTPFLGKTYLHIKCPMFLKFNTTYYKLSGKNLIAFRLLAISIGSNGAYHRPYFLIQEPNQKSRWSYIYLNEDDKIFASIEDYFEYLQGDKETNLNAKYWDKICYFLNKNTSLNVNDSMEHLECEYHYNPSRNGIVTAPSTINYFLINQDGVYISLKKRDGYFLTKEECIKNQISDMVITDFEEEPINVELTILPNKPKTYTISITESFS